MLFLQTLLSPVAVFADDKMNNAGEKRGDTNEKIRITAERMVSDSEAMWAEFIGNVEVVQGNDIIKADSLRFFTRAVLKKIKTRRREGSPSRKSLQQEM